LPAFGTNDLVRSGSSFPSGKNRCRTRRVTKFNANVGRNSKACQQKEVARRGVVSTQLTSSFSSIPVAFSVGLGLLYAAWSRFQARDHRPAGISMINDAIQRELCSLVLR
jgi:hypothetical protein